MKTPRLKLHRAAGMTCLLLALVSGASAAWHDMASPFRRSIEMTLPAERIRGEELVRTTFLTNGKQLPDGGDLHVVTANGKPVNADVVSVGPGDKVELVFDAVSNTKEYFVYFGSGKKVELKRPVNHGGLAMEMKVWTGGSVDNFRQMEDSWGRSKVAIGSMVLQRAYQGVNPFGPQDRTITRLSGSVYAPMDGEYVLAVAAKDRAALYLDNKPLVFCRHPTWDARFQDRAYLKRGWHEFSLYHVNMGQEGPLGVFWKRPDMDRFDVIPREAFGLMALGEAGALEEQNKPVTADFHAEYKGEAFFANMYTHRLALSMQIAKGNADRAKCEWDFGDGQTAFGADVEHVYVSPGLYTVKVTVKLGGSADTQSFRLNIDRDWEHSDRPQAEDVGMHSKVVAGYDLDKMPSDKLAFAALMHLRAGNSEAFTVAAKKLAGLKTHLSKSGAMKVLDEMNETATKRNEVNKALEVWRMVPADSDLNPWAAKRQADLLLWWQGDLAGALKVIEPFGKDGDDAAKRSYGQLLILNQRSDEGTKVLEKLPISTSTTKRPALSGAQARTTEFYVTEKQWENGEEAWEKWQSQFPASFIEGHSVKLRVELMELRKANAVAAKIAEAFASAMPRSPYAPGLLDHASRLLAGVDDAKSKTLRALLKQRYPEDPLSQDEKKK